MQGAIRYLPQRFLVNSRQIDSLPRAPFEFSSNIIVLLALPSICAVGLSASTTVTTGLPFW